MTDFIPVELPMSSVNDQSAIILEWTKAPGDAVSKGEVICSAETTKSVFEVEAPGSGYLTPVAEIGKEAQVGEVIAVITEAAVPRVAIDRWLAERTAVPSPAAPAEEPAWTYKAELLARRYGITKAEVRASGARVTEADVQAHYDARQQAQAKPIDPHDLVLDRYPIARVQRLLIVGGGDGAVQVLDVLAKTPHQRAIAILDDNRAIHGKEINGVPILGNIDVGRAVEMYRQGTFDAAVISISTNINFRAKVFETWQAQGIPFANVIHPSTVIGMNVAMGAGNVVMACCHLGACATLGNNNFISAYCSIEHHNVLGNHCSFGPGVVTSSKVQIGDRVRFGTGIFIEPFIEIGAESVIGSGCIIWKNIADRSLLKSRLNYVERSR